MCLRLLTTGLLGWMVVVAVASGADPVAPGPESWPAFRQNWALTGVATSPLPDKLDLLWEVELGDQIVATSALVG